MRFKLDENVPKSARRLFETLKWEVDDVYDEGLAGADDATLSGSPDGRLGS